MSRADVREVSSGCLDVVVVACDTCFMETVKLFRGHKAHGRAEVDLAFLFHSLVGVDRFIELLPRQCSS